MDLISSRHNLINTTATEVKKNEALNKWMNEFLNKADRNILSVQVDRKPLRHTRHAPGFSNMLMEEPANYGESFLANNIHFLHVGQNKEAHILPIELESSGMQRYFGLSGFLYNLIDCNRLLCIDELETSLHADLMKHFLQTFILNSTQSQLIFTTQNLYLLEEEDFIRRDALWFTEKNSNGETELYGAADFDTSVLRKGASLINAYKTGRLGAKPNLGSPYMSTE